MNGACEPRQESIHTSFDSNPTGVGAAASAVACAAEKVEPVERPHHPQHTAHPPTGIQTCTRTHPYTTRTILTFPYNSR